MNSVSALAFLAPLEGESPSFKEQFLVEVARTHGRQLTRLFQAKVPDAFEAQDLVQEVYLRRLKLKRPD